jgi:hypothetical protein
VVGAKLLYVPRYSPDLNNRNGIQQIEGAAAAQWTFHRVDAGRYRRLLRGRRSLGPSGSAEPGRRGGSTISRMVSPM